MRFYKRPRPKAKAGQSRAGAVNVGFGLGRTCLNHYPLHSLRFEGSFSNLWITLNKPSIWILDAYPFQTSGGPEARQFMIFPEGGQTAPDRWSILVYSSLARSLFWSYPDIQIFTLLRTSGLIPDSSYFRSCPDSLDTSTHHGSG